MKFLKTESLVEFFRNAFEISSGSSLKPISCGLLDSTTGRYHDKLYTCITYKTVLKVKNEMGKVRFPSYTVQIKNKLVFKNNRQTLELKRDFTPSFTAKFILVSDEKTKRSYIAQLSHFLLKEYFLYNKFYGFSCKYLL